MKGDWQKRYEDAKNRHLKRIAKEVKGIFDTVAKEAAEAATQAYREGEEFSLRSNPLLRKRIGKLIKGLNDELNVAVVNGVQSAWTLANNKNNALSDFVFGDRSHALSHAEARRYYRGNEKALEAFLERKQGGLDLSERIWNLSKDFKKDLEVELELGIGKGLSANEISRNIRMDLKDPDKLFRRVRDARGELKLSREALTYHPGQGKYRSSYKNALRVAVTETNTAYREADHLRVNQLDFVVGIEIVPSHSLSQFTKLPACPLCEQLAGKYPKDFKFVGWHPNCRCHVKSILKTEEEFDAEQERLLNGEGEPSEESANRVREVPDGFKEWVEDNKERMAAWKTQPMFVRDNFKKGRIEEGLAANMRPRKERREKTKEEREEIQQRWDTRNNHIEVSKMLGIKQLQPMPFKEANKGRGNLYYNRGDGYRVNCQSCVVAHELRRRGFDVTARPNTKMRRNIPAILSSITEAAWIDPKTGKMPRSMLANGNTTESALARLDKITEEPGRYHIKWLWKNYKSGHIITFERFQDGTGRFYDPQTGEVLNSLFDYKEPIKPRIGIRALRVDELHLNQYVVARTVIRSRLRKKK